MSGPGCHRDCVFGGEQPGRPPKEAFVLDNFELGLIGGAALWGMAISQILLGPFAELSLRRMMQLAFGGHLVGTTIMLTATFWGLDTYSSEGALPPGPTADALRSVQSSVIEAEPVEEAGSLIAPAEAYGGRMSFRWLAPFAIIIIVVFGTLHWRDVQAGGYQAKALGTEE